MKQLFFFLALFSTLICSSQSFQLGIKGGLNISNTEFNVLDNEMSSSNRDFDNRYSYYIGTMIEFSKFSNNLSIQIELIYTEQGYSVEGFKEDEILNQINIPILLKKEIFRNTYLLTGGYFGVIVSPKKDSFFNEVFDKYSNFDGGLVLGLEYEFDFGGFIETRYNYGLIDVSNTKFISPTNTVEWEYFNRVFQIGLGYKF